MTEPTDADRELAKALLPDHQSWCQVVSHLHCCAEGPDDCDCGITESRVATAAALAEERVKAREPFLRLADELDAEGDEFATYQRRYAEASDQFGAVVSEREAWTSRHAADRIRRAAEESQS